MGLRNEYAIAEDFKRVAFILYQGLARTLRDVTFQVFLTIKSNLLTI